MVKQTKLTGYVQQTGTHNASSNTPNGAPDPWGKALKQLHAVPRSPADGQTLPLYYRSYARRYTVPMPVRESRPPSVGMFAPSVDAARASPFGKPWPERSKECTAANLPLHKFAASNLRIVCNVALNSSAALSMLPAQEVALCHCIVSSLSQAECHALAMLYQLHDGCWCRLSSLYSDVTSIQSVAAILERVFNSHKLIQLCFDGASVSSEEVERLLTKQELRGKYGQIKRKPNGRSSPELLKLSGPLALLKGSVVQSLLYVHRVVLSLSGYLPEEAAPLQRLDWQQLSFPFLSQCEFDNTDGYKGLRNKVASLHSVSSGTANGQSLHDALDRNDELSTALCDGARASAMHALHMASDALLTHLDEDEGSMSRRVHARTLIRGISILEREREYEGAVHYLTILTGAGNDALTPSLRGEALCRLARDTEHYGDRKRALELGEECLVGKHGPISMQSRLQIEKLVSRLSVPPRRWKKPVLTKLHTAQTESVIIPITEAGSWQSSSGSVEGAVLDIYKTNGWKGLHAENGPWLALVPLLFWKQLFESSNWENASLSDAPDWMTPMSVNHCNELPTNVIERAEEIRKMSPALLQREISDAVEAHMQRPMVARGLPLDSAALTCLGDIAKCFGGQVIATACTQLMEDWEANAGGFPDLIVYSTESEEAVAVEVKGPGDQCSEKQLATLDLLIRAGANVKVCYARAK